MDARIWRTKRSTRWIWTRARWWRSRCKERTRATPRRSMKRCAKPEWQWRSRSGAKPSYAPNDKPKVNVAGIEELVKDKGYHSGAVVNRMKTYEVSRYFQELKLTGRMDYVGNK